MDRSDGANRGAGRADSGHSGGESDHTAWKEDLRLSRDVPEKEKDGIRFAVDWFVGWTIRQEIPVGIEAGRRFWKEVVKARGRERWQLDQWAAEIAREGSFARASGGRSRFVPGKATRTGLRFAFVPDG